jgi:hypothetical protein
MRVFDKTNVAEFLGNRVVYRNLVPADSRLPGLDELRSAVGLPPGRIPRKSEPDYARVIVALLQHARSIEDSKAGIARLIFIGDTRLNDSTAFQNICQAAGWAGTAIIVSENTAPAAVEQQELAPDRRLYLPNRWAALADFVDLDHTLDTPVNETTAVIIDLDKTALGARGRNAQVIDQARVQAVRATVAGLLGAAFDAAAFQAAYDQYNQVEYHPFTADNQDYLAYLCLVLGSGLYSRQEIEAQIQDGRLVSFRQFIDRVERRKADLPLGLAAVHNEIYTNVRAGDPTPFKPFRRNEYLATVARMGQFSDEAPIEELLRAEIVITQEVRALALEWQARGALLFGLSDKPDEASFPTPELARQGYLPIHQTLTHAVGTG